MSEDQGGTFQPPGEQPHLARAGQIEVTSKEVIRQRVWTDLRRVARPDSRFHWNFAEFIADYEGSEASAQTIQALAAWRASNLMFITPDNNLELVRRKAMEDGKRFVMSTYGITRGFLYLHPAHTPPNCYGWAATLDGMDRFAQPVGLAELRALGRFDLLLTGAAAVSTHGIRFGKGHGYFDLEWALFSEVSCLADDPLVVCAVHDCQVVDSELPGSQFDTRVDLIVTPTRTIVVPSGHGHRPGRVVWEQLEPDMIERIPPLQELQRLQKEQQ
ncbi:MAG TPA: 5-formyltetrahydrofolate cyclo-ligase [Ktedonobacteraceae bacterium]|nr:5-formyltetrahydrofolate cyclo-ligase [Ktedonobacteraceae bacterium]